MPTEKQRREAQRRKLQRQSARRRQRALTRKRNSIIATVVGLLVIAAVVVFVVVQTSGDSSSPTAKSPSATPSGSASPSASSSAKPVAAYPCNWKKSTTPAARKGVEAPPTTTPSKSGTVAMAVTTNRGAMTFTLNRAEAPCAVESFLSLATQKYFDKTPCPRVTTDGGLFVLQCGDPTGTGSGGPGYSFADELTGKEKYTSGVLAMANAGANTNGSQFFIVYKTSQLGPQYTIFGKVTKGLSVVDKVAKGGDDGSNQAGGGKPKLPISLTKVTEAS